MNRGFKNKEANFYFIILCRAGHATTSSLLAHKLTCCVARQWAGLSLQLTCSVARPWAGLSLQLTCSVARQWAGLSLQLTCSLARPWEGLSLQLIFSVARQWAGLSLQLDKYGAAVPSTVRAQLRMKGGVIDFHHVCPISMSRVKMGGGMILTPLSTTFPDEAMTRK